MGFLKKLFGGGSPSEDAQRVSELLAQCDDPDPKRREAACKALGDLGGRARAATEKLEALMNDVDGDVCNAAADAYAKVERGL